MIPTPVNAQDAEKLVAARHAVALVRDGMHVGLGSGSTSAWAVRVLGERIAREGLKIVGVPTSSATRDIALEVGVPLADDLSDFELDLAIDGADQTTRTGDIIKGGGGALLQERIVAAAAKQFIIIADSSKLVERIGSFPVPVEVFQLGWKNVARRLRKLGVEPKLRLQKSGQALVTDEGNYILDCPFSEAALLSATELAQTINNFPGVADHGIFVNMAHLLVIARGEQLEEIPLTPK